MARGPQSLPVRKPYADDVHQTGRRTRSVLLFGKRCSWTVRSRFSHHPTADASRCQAKQMLSAFWNEQVTRSHRHDCHRQPGAATTTHRSSERYGSQDGKSEVRSHGLAMCDFAGAWGIRPVSGPLNCSTMRGSLGTSGGEIDGAGPPHRPARFRLCAAEDWTGSTVVLATACWCAREGLAPDRLAGLGAMGRRRKGRAPTPFPENCRDGSDVIATAQLAISMWNGVQF